MLIYLRLYLFYLSNLHPFYSISHSLIDIRQYLSLYISRLALIDRVASKAQNVEMVDMYSSVRVLLGFESIRSQRKAGRPVGLINCE